MQTMKNAAQKATLILYLYLYVAKEFVVPHVSFMVKDEAQ